MPSAASTSSQPVTPHSSPRQQVPVAVAVEDNLYNWNPALEPFVYHLPLDLLSSLNNLVESDKTPTRLNPCALEFQPTAAPLPPPRPLKPLSAPNDPPWTLSFVQGTFRHPTDRTHLARDACFILSSPSFSLSRDIRALADKFCDRAALLKFQGGSKTITPFAAEVTPMHRLLGVEAAEEFRRCLVDVVALTFTNVWEIEVPKAMEMGDTMVAIAGVSLAAFMAQLHHANLLEGALVTQALASMFRTSASMEHLQAMHIIVTGVGARYWSMPRATREEFLGFLDGWVVGVKEDSSVKVRWVEEIKARVVSF
ncbi:hypothetical protein CPB85DRAFT_1324123 [Mucidula mucida]|nr:hypothetical protein CPB85DRAFT_1324123 [Mucidula mucida]